MFMSNVKELVVLISGAQPLAQAVIIGVPIFVGLALLFLWKLEQEGE